MLFDVATPASRGMVACSRIRCGLQKSDVNTTCLLVRRRRISRRMVCGLFSSGTHLNLSTGGSPPFPETIHSRFTAGNLLLRGQKDIFVGTLNVRTLREQYKRDELGGGQWRKMAKNGEKWRKMAMANSAFSFVKFAIFRQFLILEFHI